MNQDKEDLIFESLRWKGRIDVLLELEKWVKETKARDQILNAYEFTPIYDTFLIKIREMRGKK